MQTCINQLGSYQNLKLVNFIRGKTCLFVEGKDLKILKKFAKKFNIERFASEDGFSVNPIQGFSNWERLKHVDWIFKNTFGEKIKCYVILDRDYYPQPTIENVIQELKKKNVKVHIWSKKELENYLINPIALYRMFANKYCNRYPNTDLPLTESEFQERLLELFENLKEDVRAQMLLRELRARPKTSKDETTEFVQTSRDFEIKWADIEYRRQAIPGKKFFLI